MKALKRIALVLAALLALVLAAAFVFLDPIVGAAIEKGSTYATGVETKVGGVDASLFAGRFALQDLALANPSGFRSEPFLRLGSARASWRNGTILSDTIEMDEIVLEGVEVNLEKNSGATNWGAILDHLEKASPAQEKPAPSSSAARQLLIRKIEIRDVKAGLHVSGVPLVSGSTSVHVPSIVIEDFRSDGSTTEIVAKLTRAVLQAILDSVLSAGKSTFPADVVKDLGHGLDGLKGAVETGAKKGLLKGVQDALKDAGGLLKPK